MSILCLPQSLNKHYNNVFNINLVWLKRYPQRCGSDMEKQKLGHNGIWPECRKGSAVNHYGASVQTSSGVQTTDLQKLPSWVLLEVHVVPSLSGVNNITLQFDITGTRDTTQRMIYNNRRSKLCSVALNMRNYCNFSCYTTTSYQSPILLYMWHDNKNNYVVSDRREVHYPASIVQQCLHPS